MAYRLLTICFLILLTTIFSCNSKRAIAQENLVGSWYDTSDSRLHFTLFEDGTARSDNMATLLYQSWRVEDDSLFLTAKSIGNGSTSVGDRASKILVANNDSLVLQRGANYTETYVKRNPTAFYEGGHYGAHNPWNYLSVVTNSKHGDTLFFERLVYRNKEVIKNNQALQTDRVSMFVYNEDHVKVLSDTLSYNWQTGPKCYKHRVGDQIRTTYIDPKKINFPFDVGHTIDVKANNMTFTSVAALELYLSHVPLRVGFEKDFWMADDVLRPFRVRVLGKLLMGKPGKPSVLCYDISINSLDNKSLHTGKIFMTTQTREVVKREFVSNETKHKSVLHEFVQ